MKKTLVRKTYNNKLTAYAHCPEQGCGTCCNTTNNNSGNSGGSNTGGTNNN